MPELTPDGRYIIVRGRLWRAANPHLDPEMKSALVAQLMRARRAVGAALRQKDEEGLSAARSAVDEAKRDLGERGDPWWTDGSPDLNRHMVRNTIYAEWWAEHEKGD